MRDEDGRGALDGEPSVRFTIPQSCLHGCAALLRVHFFYADVRRVTWDVLSLCVHTTGRALRRGDRGEQ